MSKSSGKYLIKGKLRPGTTKVRVVLPVRDWLRVQTLVVAYCLRLERARGVQAAELAKVANTTRVRFIKAVSKARGIQHGLGKAST